MANIKNSSFKVKMGTRSPNDIPEKGALSYDPATGLPSMGDGVKWVPIERTRATVGVRLTDPVVQPMASDVPEAIRFYDAISYQVLSDFELAPSPGTQIVVTKPMVFDVMAEFDISSSKVNTGLTIYTYMGGTIISTRHAETATKDVPISIIGLGPIVVTSAAPLRIEIEADKNINLTIHSATLILTRQPD